MSEYDALVVDFFTQFPVKYLAKNVEKSQAEDVVRLWNQKNTAPDLVAKVFTGG